jgi:hypothetical protein
VVLVAIIHLPLKKQQTMLRNNPPWLFPFPMEIIKFIAAYVSG